MSKRNYKGKSKGKGRSVHCRVCGSTMKRKGDHWICKRFPKKSNHNKPWYYSRDSAMIGR